MLCCAPIGANAAYLRATASARSAVRSAKPISPGILINVHPARDRAPAAWPVPTGAGGNPAPVEAFESIRLSIWAIADEAPKTNTDVSATVNFHAVSLKLEHNRRKLGPIPE